MTSWRITPLAAEHDRTAFVCGRPTLDRFLKESARQNQDKGISRTFVAVGDGSARVFGYYTLTAGQVDRDALPPKVAKKLPKHPVPVIVLGRLAVDGTVQKAGLGRQLLWDALNRSAAAAESIGVFAVVVDALDDAAAGFYRPFGFVPFPDVPLKLFLPIATVGGARPTSRPGGRR